MDSNFFNWGPSAAVVDMTTFGGGAGSRAGAAGIGWEIGSLFVPAAAAAVGDGDGVGDFERGLFFGFFFELDKSVYHQWSAVG